MAQKELKEELRQISARYYAQPLRDAGFQNDRDDLLNWYKVYNGVICHFHILLSFPSRMLPIVFGWWFHPTYIPATLGLPLAWPQFDEPLLLYLNEKVLQSNLVEPGAEIPLPNLPQRGAEYLCDVFFPQVEAMQSREVVYSHVRNQILSRWEAKNRKFPLSNAITPEYADQALMLHDTELIPHCMESVEELMIARRNRKPCYPMLIWRSAEYLEAQWKALRGIEVEQYMELMKERKEKFLKKYKLQDKDFDL